MDIEKVEVGFLKENCYVLKKNNKCLIIDPGCEYEKIKEAMGNLELLGILITHRHFDHIGALEEFIRDYNPFILDFKTSKELTGHLRETNKTIIEVSQRASDMMSCDLVIVLDKGFIVGLGKHQELIKDCNVYKEICDSQDVGERYE